MSAAATSYDKEEIRFAARSRPAALFERYGVNARKSGRQLAAPWCPACGTGANPRRVLLHTTKLAFQCKACMVAGDIFKFIGIAEREREFPRVLEHAASIWGVSPTTANEDERRRRHEEWKRRNAEADARAAAEEAELRRTAGDRAYLRWKRLATHHPDGAAYLAGRGLDGVLYRGFVRYDAELGGAPALALYAPDGSICNVIHRPLDPGEKPEGMFACPTDGTLVHSVADIGEAGLDVVLAEGFADALTARVAWPDATILGATGTTNLPKVAAAAAPRVVAMGGRMLIVPDQDRPGVQAAIAAGVIARRAGLAAGSLVIVDVKAHDLNEAWQRGWRPTR